MDEVMSDLYLVSNLPTPSTRVLQALDNAELLTVDLLTLDVFEIHRRTQLSIIDVQNLVQDVISALSDTVESEVKTAEKRIRDFTFLTTGDEKINALLGGGIPIGSLTEVTGERYENWIVMALTLVAWESHNYVYNCAFMYNSLDPLGASTPEQFTSAQNLPLQHPVSIKSRNLLHPLYLQLPQISLQKTLTQL